ncbi:MAG: hypothetical protein ABI318_08970, partial [Chthoniobacteraceae bacterium]
MNLPTAVPTPNTSSSSSSAARFAILLMLAATLAVFGFVHAATPAFVVGDPVRVTHGEMLLFQGKNLVGAAKGQEFMLLKHDAARKQVFVSFLKDDNTLIAVTLPDDAVEPAAPHASLELVRGAEAFRDQRY